MSDTEINERYFSVMLPGTWHRIEAEGDDDLWVYGAEDSRERLSVSVMLTQEKQSDDQVQVLFEQFCKSRREAERGATDGVTLTDVSVTRVDGATTGFYAGEDEAGRRLANFVIVNRAGIANFCHEAFGLEAEAFADRSYEILGQVGFVEVDQ